ncbi:MAG: septal ring lytic transglycosylase RlpA family lipoprotein, partial [Bradyrhizobium sp.]|nr:septal ring lytic transglycosylase RlpA family lipoprotein [Bradyrhizobium sp.]
VHAKGKPFVPDVGAGRPIRGEVPLPEGRPYTLGNGSADLASIAATSEMSASSRTRGRSLDNPRAVSYDQNGRYAAQGRAEANDGADEARDIMSGRGLY